jgi:homoserine kinase
VRFRTAPVRVAVPATSANLGPGFDALGLALTLHDDIAARVVDHGVRVSVTGEGAGEVPGDERNLIASSMFATFDSIGVVRPPGLALTCQNRIPHARGLGSSSAAIVAGILLARSLVNDGVERLDDDAVLRLAADIEGHPDNVAACLLGGLTIAWTGQSGARAVRLRAVPGLRVVVLVPGHRGVTTQARADLPARIPHSDAAFNAARAALLVHALTADPRLLFEATEDRLHQNYRAPGMPETAALVGRLREAGVAAAVSGAGPSVLVLLTEADEDSEVIRLGLPDGWCFRSLSVAEVGARILVSGHAEGDPVAAGRLR